MVQVPYSIIDVLGIQYTNRLLTLHTVLPHIIISCFLAVWRCCVMSKWSYCVGSFWRCQKRLCLPIWYSYWFHRCPYNKGEPESQSCSGRPCPCLPDPITPSQTGSQYLSATIHILQPQFVVTLGQVALKALQHIERHPLILATHVGIPHKWYNRWLIPLYHPGLRARLHRPLEMQLADFRALGSFIRIQTLPI